MAETNESRLDWPMVVLIAVVVAGAIAALRVLGIDKGDIAAITPQQWLVIASIVGGAAGTLVAAFRREVYRGKSTSTSTSRPPPGPGAGPVAVLLLAAAIAIPVPGCGAGALASHRRAASIAVLVESVASA